MAPTRTTTKPAKKPAAKPTAARMSLDEVMRTLEKAGSAQTKKTYARHGAKEPMFGVLFGTLKQLVDRIGSTRSSRSSCGRQRTRTHAIWR